MSTSWNNTANWSTESGGTGGASVPTSANPVYFDDGGTGNCTLDVNADCASLNAAAGYTGTINLSTFDLTSATGGDIIFENSTLTFGTGTIWIDSGALEWNLVGTFNGTAGQKFRFTGTCTCNPTDYYLGGGLTVDASAVVTVSDRIDFHSGTISISGKYTQNSPVTTQWGWDADIAINTGGELEYTGAGSFHIINCTSGHGFTVMDGTITGVGKIIYLINWASGSNVLPASTNYNVAFYFWCNSAATYDAYITLETGNYSFTDLYHYNDGAYDLYVDFSAATTITTGYTNLYVYSTGSVYIDNSGSTNINIGQSLREYGSGGGTFNWTKGTGTLTFDGAADSYLDMSDPLEDIVVDKTGSYYLTFLGATNCESLTVTAGLINNSNQDISVGNVTFGAGTIGVIYGTGTWTISGSWDSSASPASPSYSNSNMVFTGSGQTIANSTQHDNWWNVTINGTYTFNGDSFFYAWNSFNMGAGSSLTLAGNHLYIRGSADIAGTVTYSGATGWATYLVAEDSGSNPTTVGVSGAGSITTWNIYFYPLRSGSQLRLGTYSPANAFYVYNNSTSNYTWQPLAGTYTFNNIWYMYAGNTGNMTIDCTNNPTFEFNGHVRPLENAGSTGLVQFTNYTGTLVKLTGTLAGQYFLDGTRGGTGFMPNVEIDKSGGYARIASDFNFYSFLLTQGEFRPDGYTLDVDVDFDVLANTSMNAATLDASIINVGGDFDVAGASGSLLDLTATAAWYLNVTGSGVATYTDVAYSDASGGSSIIANDGTNVDSNNNFNWIFPSASISISPSVSASISVSPSISLSPSISISPSISESVSPSLSPSQVISASISASLSPSISFSHSPSISFSHSPSVSASYSPSISFSHSPSISFSHSPSISLSPSISPSTSVSVGPAEITKFATEVLGYLGASAGSGLGLTDVRVIIEDLLGGDEGSDDWDYSGWVT